MRISDKELKTLLLSSGKVKPEAFSTAETVHEQTGKPLLTIILERKLISETSLLKLYAKSIDAPYVELSNFKVTRDVLTKIPERIARKYQAVVFGKKDGHFLVAMADPEDFQAVDFLTKQIGTDLRISLAATSDIIGLIDQYKGNIAGEITKAIRDSAADEEEASGEVSARDLAEDAPIAKTVNVILEYAIKSGASDVHLEPRENLVQVRYRIDGILHETMTLPRPLLSAVVSRIKILSNLKIDEHRIPQDGRFKFAAGSKLVALRVSTLPIMDGEKVVMRILDESSKPLTLEELGFSGHALGAINSNLSKPHGMLLVTGPTGSGKSTTLYSALNILNTPLVNISTIEDPVEYRMNGVNQTQVNPRTGMTFASGLRALLRQDPNIIMVGEVRDDETADLAVQASLTGHTVLSTLHTNNAATTLPRLLDMGIEPFLIASTVNAVIGQRLVRKLCPVCKISYIPGKTEIAELKEDFDVEKIVKIFHDRRDDLAKQAAIKTKHSETEKAVLERVAADPNIMDHKEHVAIDKPVKPTASKDTKLKVGKNEFILYKQGRGCGHCGDQGYKGRMGIYEVLEVDSAVSKMIVSRSSSEDIQTYATEQGMLTMQQDGFLKTLMGLTALEEIMRVTRE